MTESAALRNREHERLARLRQLAILDTRPEPVFDALTELAADICETPIALVTVVDAHRQWFKSNFGLPGTSETPRDVAFCSHTIESSEIMEVEDAAVDERFAENPLVTGAPNIRFYAGAPITLSSGHCLGALCVIDRVPRKLSHRQADRLAKLSFVVAQAMEFRERAVRAVAAAVRNQESLENYYAQAPAMMHSIDADGRIFTVSANWLAELGYTADEITSRHIAEFFTPESAERMTKIGLPALWRAGRCDNVPYQMVRRDGSKLHVSVSAIVERDGSGRVLRSLAVVTKAPNQTGTFM